MELSSSTIGILIGLAVLAFAASYYYGTEKQRIEFLSNRIKSAEEDEEEGKSKRKQMIEARLRDIGSPISADKLMSYSTLGIFGALGLSFVLGILPLGVVAAIGAYKFPEVYLTVKKDKLDAEFNKQFPDCIDSLLAILQAGQTPLQGYKVLSEDAPYPASMEFRRIYNDIQTGATLESSLMSFFKRHPSSDTKLFMTGMVIAADAAPVALSTLRTISQTIRNRESQKKGAKSAIMQGKYTARIMSAMPVLAFAGMLTVAPAYMMPFIESSLGQLLLLVAAVLNIAGYFATKKISDTSSIVKY